MALSFSSALGSVVRHFFKVYMRATGTAIAAGDIDTLANWTTHLALYAHIGYCEDKQTKYDEIPNTVPIEYGKKHPVTYTGSLEVKLLQNAKADFDAIEAMKAENCDLLLVDNVNHIYIYIHNKRFKVVREIISGGIPNFTIQLNQVAGELTGAYATVYEYGSIPTS